MIIEVTYFVYKDINEEKQPSPRVKLFEESTGIFETDGECFAYLCQRAWNEKQSDEDIDKIEIICY